MHTLAIVGIVGAPHALPIWLAKRTSVYCIVYTTYHLMYILWCSLLWTGFDPECSESPQNRKYINQSQIAVAQHSEESNLYGLWALRKEGQTTR